jgi:hypothetical protein
MKNVFVAIALLATAGGAFAQATVGTSIAADATLSSKSPVRYAWADGVDAASGTTAGFASSFADLAAADGSTWTQLGSSAINGADLGWNYTVAPSQKSGTFSITSNKTVVFDLAVAVHAGNASGAWLFDNMGLKANGTKNGTFAINWTNDGSQPDFSNIRLFARDLTVITTAGGAGGGANMGANMGSLGAISPVPEPQSYAMMLAALGAIAFVARHKRS